MFEIPLYLDPQPFRAEASLPSISQTSSLRNRRKHIDVCFLLCKRCQGNSELEKHSIVLEFSSGIDLD